MGPFNLTGNKIPKHTPLAGLLGAWRQVGQAGNQRIPEFSGTGSWGLPLSLLISQAWLSHD